MADDLDMGGKKIKNLADIAPGEIDDSLATNKKYVDDEIKTTLPAVFSLENGSWVEKQSGVGYDVVLEPVVLEPVASLPGLFV